MYFIQSPWAINGWQNAWFNFNGRKFYRRTKKGVAFLCKKPVDVLVINSIPVEIDLA
jgi:hypothetical protein